MIFEDDLPQDPRTIHSWKMARKSHAHFTNGSNEAPVRPRDAVSPVFEIYSLPSSARPTASPSRSWSSSSVTTTFDSPPVNSNGAT